MVDVADLLDEAHRLNGHTVIGTTLRACLEADIELYSVLRDVEFPQFGAFGLNAIARLDSGMSPEAAQARLTELFPRIQEQFPDLGPGFLESAAFSVTVGTLRDRMVADVESTLWIILGTVAFVLLIACANVANLFLVRAESRQKEMAVRTAMGAGRRSLAVSFLSESLLLGIGGGIVGVLLASAGVRTLLAVTEVPRAAEVSVDAASLGLAALLSVAAGLVFGAVPMTRYAGRRVAHILRDGGRGSTTGRERHRARNALVAAQLALGLVLLVGSGLMLRSFAALRAIDIGFEADGVLTMGLNRNGGEDAAVAARFYQEVADRIAALPGVAELGITNTLPLVSGAGNGGSFFIEGEPREEGTLPLIALYRGVGPSYFTSLGIPSFVVAPWSAPTGKRSGPSSGSTKASSACIWGATPSASGSLGTRAARTSPTRAPRGRRWWASWGTCASSG
jgi:predicted permease